MRKVKHGVVPGQIPRRLIIALRERPLVELDDTVWGWGARTFRRYMKRKTTKVERRRAKAEARP
jgi:hypothetical protein